VAAVCNNICHVETRVRPVSGIGRYLPILVGISIGRYLFEYWRWHQ